MMKINLITAISLLISSNFISQTITNYTTADGLLHNNVNSLDVDASNQVWLGTQAGVSVFDGSTWTNHTTTTDSGLIDNNIQAIYVTNSGDVWVGTDFGVSKYSTGVWTSFTSVDGLGNNQVKCISEDASGNIWFGTNNGASQFDGTSTWTSYGTTEGLPFGGVNSIDVHSNGDVWMGTGLSGMYIYDGSAFTSITATDGLIDNRIREMVIDGSDNKWVATSEGISVVNSIDDVVAHHTIIFTLPAPDTLNPIEDIEIDSKGNIWAGVYVDYLVTEGGVCAYDGTQWTEYTVANGLVGPVVRAIAINNNDEVWVATSTGVSLISDPTLDVTELTMNSNFVAYPNPNSTSKMHISSDANISISFVTIYNTQMQLINTQILSNGNNAIDLSNLNSGVYFLNLIHEQGSETIKIIKQ
ncbi:MAG: ligand-binding sensor domain-containing protein [Flavobacteriales bacterium]|jgi:ligand-binding sensor domain-containing protein